MPAVQNAVISVASKMKRKRQPKDAAKSHDLHTISNRPCLCLHPSPSYPTILIRIRQLIQQLNTQNHNQQPNRNHNEQPERKPAQYHRRSPHPTPDTPVPKVLGDLGRGDRGRVLPQYGDEDEDGGDEDEGEGDLRDGARGEGFDVDVGAGAGVRFFVPAGEGGEQDEGYKDEDYCYDAVALLSAYAHHFTGLPSQNPIDLRVIVEM